ncbi:CRAL-TRIO domain-containing protein [Mariannaea sp. PMI_226]|nr:CRAL-TRIO domain-containing protein [Mariannaea sp. PMI_226]
MAYEVPPGRPGNLTAEQEEKLRKLWAQIFQLTGVADESAVPSEAPSEAPSIKEDAAAEADSKKKGGRFGVFRRKGDAKSGASTPTSIEHKDGEDDKYGQTKQYYETLAKETPESIRSTIWSMVKHDHPDALVLRFLRARKWDVEKALVMLVSTMNWRHSEMGVDEDIMKNGDGAAVEDEKKTNSSTNQISKDFMSQLRMGKSFLHGLDKSGRPICVVRVRLHKQGEQCEPSLEKYTVYIIETARMVLEPPVDTACIVFDMTGFSMANMDYTPVKFMIKCFEANYPESLGVVLVHKAPWLFQGIWRIIRGWLDPVVAAKVHFTNNKAELEEFIEPGRIIKELEGNEIWEYKYLEPIPGENDRMEDTVTRDRLLAEREELVKQFEHATRQWIRNPDETIKAEREELASQLRADYWKLDPYIRARTLYDRQGAIQSGGKTDWYSLKPPAASVAETSANDLD